MLVSVVVAMKDEEEALPRLAREMEDLASRLEARGDSLEWVLVDDGSTDRTAEVSAELCAGREDRKLVSHAVNRGFGAGLRTGVAATRGDVVVSYDADCSYPVRDVITLLDTLATGADVAAATPFAPGGEHQVSAFRLFLSRACSLCYRVALRGRARGIRTFTCAFRAYRGDLIRGLSWRADGFVAAAEILSRALLAGATVREVPSTLREREEGVSKMRVGPTAVAHLRLLSSLSVARSA